MKYLEFDLTKRDAFQPKLNAYILDDTMELPTKKPRPAVVICPGGAYAFRSAREGEPIAMQYLAADMNAFLLQYSVAPSRYPTSVLELAEAVKLVREHAKEWNIDPEKIAVMGFSAGGHLAGSLGTLWDRPVFYDAFGPSESWKPNGTILCYPVLTMGEFTHEGSRDNLLGEHASQEQLDALSLEKQVSEKTVPAFLWHTQEDEAVPVENSLQYAAALRKHKVPFELHIYEKGGHGTSLCSEITAGGPEHLLPDNVSWMDQSIRWMKRL